MPKKSTSIKQESRKGGRREEPQAAGAHSLSRASYWPRTPALPPLRPAQKHAECGLAPAVDCLHANFFFLSSLRSLRRHACRRPASRPLCPTLPSPRAPCAQTEAAAAGPLLQPAQGHVELVAGCREEGRRAGRGEASLTHPSPWAKGLGRARGERRGPAAGSQPPPSAQTVAGSKQNEGRRPASTEK